MFLWGCSPSKFVEANTNMIKEIISVFETKFDPATLMLKIPEAFERLKGEDAQFEMVTSNTIQTLQLEYQDRIVTKSQAIIFVNTEINKLASLTKEEKKEEVIKFHEKM